ncbi:hypothetical protein JCM8547_008334 [Rhodosporidiobolus lusitaniae]
MSPAPSTHHPLDPATPDELVHGVELGPMRPAVPLEPEYDYAFQSFPVRTSLKPLQVIQLKGTSFKVTGNLFVPYGDLLDPLHRKGAFDLGNVGAGITANDLSMGCDCLGVIHYFPGASTVGCDCLSVIHYFPGAEVNSLSKTVPRTTPFACTRLKHTNHEYLFYFYFYQSGEIIYETRAMGILSMTPIDPENTERVPFATRVGEGVLAPYHQHIFNLCIPKDLNPHGTSYMNVDRTIKMSGTENTNPSVTRVFKIVNPNKINPVSLNPVGYKLVPYPSQNLLALPDSYHSRSADFAHTPIWVTKYKDCELFPAGDYTNQSHGRPHSIKIWVSRNDNIENEDIVLWHTYTFTHNPRPEDFPIMPAEMVRIHLKPNSFFTYNPTMDVPPSNQAFNKSSKAFDKMLKMGADSGPAATDGNGLETNGNGLVKNGSCCKV